MKRLVALAAAAASLLLLPACMPELYHMGGLKPAAMQEMQTFCVQMFENHSTQPEAGMMLTTALTDAMQRDGTYRLASSKQADFILSGEVTHISRESLLTDPKDTYLSREVGINVHVRYTVRNGNTGATVMERTVTGQGSYFGDTGNVQSAVSSALSAATRRAAESITDDLTTP